MLDEVTLGRSAIAYLYNENPQLRRKENLEFYDRVTAAGVAVPAFAVEGNELVLRRDPTPNQSGLEIRVGAFGPRPQLRLLVAQVVGDDPVELTRENADWAWKAFRGVWGEKIGRPALTEVTLECTVPAPGGNSKEFLRSRVAGLSAQALLQLRRENEGFGLRFITGPTIVVGDHDPKMAPLAGAGVDLRIETFMASPSNLYMACKASWPNLLLAPDHLPPDARSQVEGDVLQINADEQAPPVFLTQVYEYVTENVLGFLREAGK